MTSYMKAALNEARYEELPEGGGFYGEIPDFAGLWARGKTMRLVEQQLEEALEEWVLLRIWQHLPIPIVGGIELIIKEAAVGNHAPAYGAMQLAFEANSDEGAQVV